MTFWAFFSKKLAILGQKCSFRHISPKRYYVPHFCHRNIFFGLLKNGGKYVGGKFSNLPFWAFFNQKLLKISNSSMFWPKIDWKPFDIISFTWNILSWVFLLHFHLFWFPLWPNMVLFRYPCCAKIAQNQCTFSPKCVWKLFYVWFV